MFKDNIYGILTPETKKNYSGIQRRAFEKSSIYIF